MSAPDEATTLALTKREASVCKFALHRFLWDAHGHAVYWGQQKSDDSALEKFNSFMDDAKTAEQILEKL